MYFLYEVTIENEKILLITSTNKEDIDSFERHEEDVYSVEYYDGVNYTVIE